MFLQNTSQSESKSTFNQVMSVFYYTKLFVLLKRLELGMTMSQVWPMQTENRWRDKIELVKNHTDTVRFV
jgi:hypothetical protein